MSVSVRFLEVMNTNEEVIKSSDLIWTFVETPSLSDGQYDITKLNEVVNDFKFGAFIHFFEVFFNIAFCIET